MAVILLICLPLLCLVWLTRKAVKDKKTSESQLSIFEHPATFKRPDIEMTSPTIDPMERKGHSETQYPGK